MAISSSVRLCRWTSVFFLSRHQGAFAGEYLAATLDSHRDLVSGLQCRNVGSQVLHGAHAAVIHPCDHVALAQSHARCGETPSARAPPGSHHGPGRPLPSRPSTGPWPGKSMSRSQLSSYSLMCTW